MLDSELEALKTRLRLLDTSTGPNWKARIGFVLAAALAIIAVVVLRGAM